MSHGSTPLHSTVLQPRGCAGQSVFKKAHRPAWVTAVMFCRRYYAIKSLQRNDVIIFAAAALHLAGKAEDDQQKLDKVIHAIFLYRRAHFLMNTTMHSRSEPLIQLHQVQRNIHLALQGPLFRFVAE